MTTEQWPEAIGLGPLYGRPTDLRTEEAQRSPHRRRMVQLAHSEAFHDDIVHDDAALKLYRDGAELVDVDQDQPAIPPGYLSAVLPHIRETGGRVLFPRPAEPDDEDHPEDCGCPDCRDDADRDTADEHDYDYEIWADADASREGEGL